ncbi:AsmA-like C-terminal domain-containing protein [Rhodospira trueperi]|uniref:YhdP central domain-containing protein n=1 Tax=Rhodospira trueperi TaxID=69960 RepID=A0A1G7CC65_9PROT|nr:AsmA-like C-terminal domain-containing protein [Rhodospira trueperi]SDE36964.1 Protein of unknown function [Rhodospira trueperi]
MAQRAAHKVAKRLGRLLGLLILGMVALAWTAGRGPLDVAFLTPRIEMELTRAVRDAGMAADVRVGGAAVSWNRAAWGFDIDLDRVRLVGPDARPLARVGAIRVTLDLDTLLSGQPRASNLALVGPVLHARRHEDGHFTLDLEASLDGGAGTGTGGARPPTSPSMAQDNLTVVWETLADLGLALREARLVVEDRVTGRAWRLAVPDLQVIRDRTALRLEASVVLDAEPPAPVLDVAVRYAPGDDTASAVVAAQGLNPARDLADRLGWPVLAGWSQSLDATLTADLDLGAEPSAEMIRQATLSISGGPGKVSLPEPIDHTWAPRSLEVEARLTRAGRNALDLTVESMTLGLPGVSLAAAGRLTGGPNSPTSGAVDIRLSSLTVETLVRHWPPALADGARDWIAKNIATGDLHEGRFMLHLGGAGLSDVSVIGLFGGARVEGATVTYLEGLPAATEASGTVQVGLDAVTIAVDGGGVGDVRIREGTVALTALDTDSERGDMLFEIDTPLSDALALIDHQPLGYASRLGVDPGVARGDARVTLTLGLPLRDDVALDELEVGVTADATGVGLPDVTLGQDLSDGDLSLSLDGTGMDVAGTARLGDVPITLEWRENFTDGAAFDRRYHVRGRLDNAARARFRLSGPPFQPPWMDGPVDGDLTYTDTAGAPATLTAQIDLAPATLAMDALGWTKPADIPGRADVEARFTDEAMTVDFDVTTAADGSVQGGRARLTGTGDMLDVSMERVRLGETDVSARIVAPDRAGDPYDIALGGPSLDVRAVFKHDESGDGPASETGGPPGRPGPPLALSLDVGQARVTESMTFRTLRGTLSSDAAGLWSRADLQTRAGDGRPARIAMAPDGGVRRFSVEAEDAGAFASDLGVTGRINGGRLSLSGTLDPDNTAEGVLRIDNFNLYKTPVLARILAVASLTGILDELQGEGLSLSKLIAPFRYADGVLTLSEARANGASLGLTANGVINLRRSTLDLNGVVVPLYLINSLLGGIPLLGDLLVGEKGGGVFAVNYSAEGALGDPSVSVNPLSVVTPGFLRGVFDGLPDGGDDQGAAAPTPGTGE